jgi:hypothetical protein
MSDQVNTILEENKLADLKNFLSRRHILNRCNSCMIYLFHIVQTVGILATSLSASTNDTRVLWVGIGLNMTASIIQIYEKINNDQMKRILLDIQSIKNGTYIDESAYIDPEATNIKMTQNPGPTNEMTKTASKPMVTNETVKMTPKFGITNEI